MPASRRAAVLTISLSAHLKIGQLLKGALRICRDAADKKTIEEMINDHESVGRIFRDIVANREETRLGLSRAVLSQEIEDRLISQLNMKLYNVTLQVRKLQASSRRDLGSAFKLTVAGIIFVFVILTAATLINSRMLGLTIMERIRRLRDGALFIGGGTLDQKIDITGDDEFTELAEEFNNMTAKLRASNDDREREIDERKKAEAALLADRERLDLALSSSKMATFDWDIVNNERSWSDGVHSLLGTKPEAFTGSADEFFQIMHPEDRSTVQAALARAVETGQYETEYRAIWLDGSIHHIAARGKVHRDTSGQAVLLTGVCWDITERKLMEEELKQMAHHDVLTGLPNRRLLIDILNVVLAQARRRQNKLAILFLDLDGFKFINDTLGHDIGDELLKEVAERIRHSIRESDTVARIGGDEFNVVLTEIAHVEDVSGITNKIIAALKEPFRIRGHEQHSSSSIGISVYPDDADTMDGLFKCADIAMYHAKRGGNTYLFYSPSMHIQSI